MALPGLVAQAQQRVVSDQVRRLSRGPHLLQQPERPVQPRRLQRSPAWLSESAVTCQSRNLGVTHLVSVIYGLQLQAQSGKARYSKSHSWVHSSRAMSMSDGLLARCIGRCPHAHLQSRAGLGAAGCNGDVEGVCGRPDAGCPQLIKRHECPVALLDHTQHQTRAA